MNEPSMNQAPMNEPPMNEPPRADDNPEHPHTQTHAPNQTNTVNGEDVTWPGGSVEDLLVHVTGSAPRTGVAVAVNGSVVAQSRWSQRVEAGQTVDILVAVQGG